jgi:ribose 5-phosphate isomerase RpiB
LKSIFKNICIASDHAGYDLKEYIKDFLINNNLSVIDLGPNTLTTLILQKK